MNLTNKIRKIEPVARRTGELAINFGTNILHNPVALALDGVAFAYFHEATPTTTPEALAHAAIYMTALSDVAFRALTGVGTDRVVREVYREMRKEKKV